MNIKRLYEDSYNALMDAYRGKAAAALAHLYDASSDSCNIEGVDFIPLREEWLDIVLLKQSTHERMIEAITKLTCMRPFHADIDNIVGYYASHMGRFVFES